MPASTLLSNSVSPQGRLRSGPWIVSSTGNVFYRPESVVDHCPPEVRFPAPLIGPRRTRPHAIHIVTYPPGYVPRELRPDARPRTQIRRKARREAPSRSTPNRSRGAAVVPPLIWAAGNPNNANPSTIDTTAGENSVNSSTNSSRRNSHISLHDRRNSASLPLSLSISLPSPHLIRPALGKLIASFSGRSLSKAEASPTGPLSPAVPSSPAAAPSLLAPTAPPVPSVDRTRPTTAPAGSVDPPPYDEVCIDSAPAAQRPPLHSFPSPSSSRSSSYYQSTPHSADIMAVAGNVAVPPLIASHITGRRNSLMSVRTAKSAVSSLVTEVPKPVASGSGVSCSILLAERNVFLTGFDHDTHGQRDGHSGTSLLRGKLQINVTKNVKIKAITLKLMGRARTEWPEGIPPQKQEIVEEESLRTQVLTFFNAMNEGWSTEYGNQCSYNLKTSSANSSTTNVTIAGSRPPLRPATQAGGLLSSASSRSGLSAKELKRLSLQNTQSRSFGKSENGIITTTQAKGFKVFYPGTYDYTFELPIDHHQLETTKLQYGSVKWELHASVDRAGAFKPNLHGTKEVSIVRLPDQMSLETTEPISISRQWEDQLHYDIVISGKSFPIGSRIPIAFKLTPLAKVQVHKLKVYVTESIEYWTNDKRVTRKDPGRKILLLEKSAGKPLDSNWALSDVNTVRGGEPTQEQRRQAREIADSRRAREAARHGRAPEPLPEPASNLLGDLDLGLESMWGSTELEANVQLPTCEMMAKNKDLRLHPDCSWKNVNVFHWIKIVLRISRIDSDDPTGTKRRHFEISIDSPFTVLNCRATQANTDLPAYGGPTSHPMPYQTVCGCADSATIPCNGSPNSSTGTLPGTDLSNDALPLPPQAAHLAHSTMNPATSDSRSPARSVIDLSAQNEPRPIHLLRVPSFNPPAFDDDTAPPPAPILLAEDTEAVDPPLITPPPQYDVVVGTPSVDGLADYFTRLADYGYVENDDENDSGSDSDESPARILNRSGRVNVSHPRTPGGRMPSRSFEISRPTLNLNLASLPDRSVTPTASGPAS